MGKFNVFLAVPHNGQVAALTAAALAFASQRKDDPYTIGFHFESGSLLAYNFNRLWCEARNRKADGEPFTHFAMLHSDVAPDAGWLDVLLDEQIRTGADVVSAVIPLKDQRGLTSTAIQQADGKDFRRLTMAEIHKLPETFDAAGAGKPGWHLLVNTGCWVCAFDRPWIAEFPGFHIEDWIHNEADGTCQPGVFSEDWNASAWWNRRGLKICATRKVKLLHWGPFGFGNARPWGDWLTDLTDARRPRAEGIEGWMTSAELHWLRAKAAECRFVVEIGSWKGRSTHALAETCPGTVFAVDHFRGSPGPDIPKEMSAVKPGEVEEAFHKNLNGYLQSGKVRLLKGTSEAAAERFRAERVKADFVFLDGDHRYEAVSDDIRRWKSLVRPGGILCGHDSDERGVRQALDELLPGWKPGPVRLWEYEVKP